MKIIRKLLAAAASAAMAAAAFAFPASAASSAKDIVSDMGLGWNLGNTLDCQNCSWITNELDYETGWGNPKVTKALIDKVSDLGFSSIRIPVSWHDHVDANNNISSVWMNRVKQIVDYAIDDGLYVIVNIHHDNGIQYNGKNFFYPSSTYLTTSKNYVTKIWTQISGTFKDYDQHLIFETLNEPRLIGDSNEWWFTKSNPQTKVKDAINCINTLNQAAVDTIRSSGGNNKNRLIMVPGYDASIDGATTPYFKLPSDSSNMIAVSVHGYLPNDFALNAGGTAEYSSTVKTGVTSFFSTIKSSLTSKGIPVVIGEFGATDKKNSAARAKWATDYTALAAEQGVACLLWDNNAFTASYENNYNEKFGFINRSNLTVPDQAYMNALFSSYKKAAKNNLKDAKVTVKNASYTYTGKAIAPASDITVNFGGKTLTKDTDYTVSFSNNTNVGTATATVTGKGSYSGTNSVQFVVSPAKNEIVVLSTDDNKINVKWKEDSSATGYQVLYSTDSSFRTSVSIVVQNKAYTTFSSRVSVGKKYYVKVRSFYTTDGKTSSTKYGVYSDAGTIVAGSTRAIRTVTLKNTSYNYTGSTVRPDYYGGKDYVIVKDSTGQKLLKNVDYKITYKNNKKLGTATMIVTGIGDCSGICTKEYIIKPAKVVIMTSTSKGSSFSLSWTKASPGSTGYEVKIATDRSFNRDAKTFTVTDLSKTSLTVNENIKPGQTWYVKVRAFVTLDGNINSTRYGDLSIMKVITVK